jgi:AcrR family transcriptional regulator
MSSAAEPRRKNARGDASRERILDAAGEVAGDRGYEGTSINLVSERSGLPASSIYWHFKDKDELIAAVIERNFAEWVESLDRAPMVPHDGTRDEAFRLYFQSNRRALAEFPQFVRLGLMLLLERRPQEPTARAKFMQVRRLTQDRLRHFYGSGFPELREADIDSLVGLTIALADGFFLAQEAGEGDLEEAFDLMATCVLGTAKQLAERASSREGSRGPALRAGRPSPGST